MKVVIINNADISGGAARAAYRLHQGLQCIDIESRMLVQKKTSDDITVIAPETKKQKTIARVRPIIDSAPIKRYKKKTKSIFSPAWVPFSSITGLINSFNPDVVHFHWIAGGMLRIEDLTKIKKPIVWSLHDMWAFTGGCHYDSLCAKYKHQCGKCPVLGSSKEKDLSFRIFKRKEKAYKELDEMNVVGLSKWLANCAKESKLLGDKSIVNLPNPIDTEIFKPLDKVIAREILNLPGQKKLILFGAMSAVSDPRKGFNELVKALEKLNLNNVELAIFGSNKPANPIDFGFPAHYLGRFYDDIALRVLYSAADVMVTPSLQENLSNVVMESIACGTPVVAFNIGGNPDMIDHQKNGYLAKPYDTKDLAEGIKWILNYPYPDELRNNARQKVLENFEMTRVAEQYKSLYEEIINHEKN